MAAREHPVEAAIREGKIPESRRGHYYNLFARKRRKTTRILASLEPVLEPPQVMEGVREYVEEQYQAAPVAAAASAPTGPTSYPKGWLKTGEAVGATRAFGGAGTIVKEEGVSGGAGPGEVL